MQVALIVTLTISNNQRLKTLFEALYCASLRSIRWEISREECSGTEAR